SSKIWCSSGWRCGCWETPCGMHRRSPLVNPEGTGEEPLPLWSDVVGERGERISLGRSHAPRVVNHTGRSALCRTKDRLPFPCARHYRFASQHTRATTECRD